MSTRLVTSVAHHNVAPGPSSGYQRASAKSSDDLLLQQTRVRSVRALLQIQDKLVKPGGAIEQNFPLLDKTERR